MKKLSEYEGEEALDLLADLVEPAVSIFGDEELRNIIQGNDENKKIVGIKYAIKNHKSEVMDILAILEGVKRKDLKVNVFTLPKMILEILNDGELLDFFSSQAQLME